LPIWHNAGYENAGLAKPKKAEEKKKFWTGFIDRSDCCCNGIGWSIVGMILPSYFFIKRN